jgi:drug/metabolite transporter (DMT)-like permease
VTRSYPVLLGFLAVVWGGSYFFIAVAVDEIEPAPMMFLRMAGAGVLLALFLAWQRGAAVAVGELRAAWRPGLALGLINAALPFTLIAWGQKHIDSGVAAIANATVPIFVVLLAIRFKPSERATGLRFAGILLGLVGVGVLTGGQPELGWWAVAGVGAVVLASASYAAGGIYGQLRVAGTPGPVLAAASMLFGALIILPLAAVQVPAEMPGWQALASVAALTVGGTALAQLVLYRTLRLHGASRLSLVTYLMPPIALVYGVLLLGEPLTAGVLGGLALILLGVGLGSGGVRLPRRTAAPATPHG